MPFKRARLPAVLAALFAVFGLIGVAAIALRMPPFQNPDETDHFMRAYQVSRLVPIGHRLGPSLAGGAIDTGLIQAIEPGRVAASPAVWTGEEDEEAFPNTAVYPPLLYLPGAAAIGIGKLAHLRVVATLILARLLTGGVAIVIGAFAIAASGSAAPWLFSVLCLPGSLAQIASPSQDSLMFVLAALAAALIAKALRQGIPPSRRVFWGAVAALAVIAQARPPYAALALLLLLLPRTGLCRRLAGLAVVVVACLGWAAYAASHAFVNFSLDLPPGMAPDALAQLDLLAREPSRVLAVLWHTARPMASTYWLGLLGRLGPEEIWLPRAWYEAASVVVVLAALLCLRGDGPAPDLGRALTVLAVLGFGVFGILGLQYIAHTPIGAYSVAGVQGRYFLPLLLFLPAALPLCWPPARWRGTWIGLAALIAAFPLVSLAATLRAIALRYLV